MVYILKYDSEGWVRRREPYDLGEIDESIIAGSIEVSDEIFMRTLSTPSHHAWRVVNGEVVNERFEEDPREEWVEVRILDLKKFLANTDYQAIKFTEGAMTEQEYAPIRTQRAAWRAEINELEQELEGL